MSERPAANSITSEEQWRRLLSGEDRSLVRGRELYRHFPHDPRCKLCNAPFAGVGGWFMSRAGFRQWPKNPRFCEQCHKTLAKHAVGGAEVEISVLFADVRGSTSMAEQMRPAEFKALIDRFYRAAGHAIVESDGLLDNYLGDGILALFIPVWAGREHTARAVAAGRDVLRSTGNDGPRPWIPVGVGIHTGVAFVGVVSRSDEADDFTALGDTVNTASRLAAAAGTGELLVSVDVALAAGLPIGGAERRSLDLKGKSEPMDVAVLHA